METRVGKGIIRAAAIQFQVGMDIARNLTALTALLEFLPAATLAVAPEGALSGYWPEPDFVQSIDQEATAGAIDLVASLARRKRLHLIAGACVREAGLWRNRSLYFGPDGETARYDKINLAQIERAAFTPGDSLPVFDIEVDGTPLRLGIQMCREIRYPEQWRMLAVKGAHVIAYVNNAVGSPRGDVLWRAHMISRAAEVQRFVVGANNAGPDQTCPSMIVAPDGRIISEASSGAAGTALAELDLAHTSDSVLSQARIDVVEVRTPITA